MKGILRRPACLRGAAVVLAALLAGPTAAGTASPQSGTLPGADDATILHVLSRLSWGVRPGDLEAARATGLSRWIERQLHPEQIDDRVAQQALASLPTLQMSPSDLMAHYELPPAARRELQARRAQLENAGEAERRAARRELMEKYGASMEGTPNDVLGGLQAGKVLRATTSERQLEDVLVDFWMNHFNVDARKGPVRFLAADYERTVRSQVWGRFEDLLVATAESPAMLFYLDNWLSVDPQAAERLAQERERQRLARAFARGRFGPGYFPPPPRDPSGNGNGKGQRARAGLNENYARELMELHTLGVDGGYTQKDVTEVARVFTGWTIEGLRENQPRFVFDARRHDPGPKVVLGQQIHGGGADEGLLVLHRLASHPSTAHFIASKLVRRFVSDDPPAALVDRAARCFLDTQGDLRAVVRTIVTSPELLAPAARGAKVKTPLEFVVSAVRATGARVEDAHELARRIGGMGMPLYAQQPPTGYKDTADAWVSTSGLVARLNFALDLSGGRVRGVSVPDPSPGAAPQGASAADALAARLLPAGLSDATRRTIEAEAKDGLTTDRVAGLLLGSPEFQRR